VEHELLLSALEQAVGPALVLDRELRVVAATPAVEAMIGAPPERGVPAPKLLCGYSEERPVAEALAAGRPVKAEILRPDQDGENHVVHVRASPFEVAGERAWLILLDADPDVAGAEVEELGMVTRDPRMKALLRDIRKVARSNASVLVRGETGSGKELVARAIHDCSSRADGPFRAINCAALPPNLLESELFGHARGSFTGAVRDTPGHFRLAEGGTLFLDEVAELPLDVQAKLLRVLQEKTVIPIGGQDPVPIDVRVISATHRALRHEVVEGRFRSDLLYRLRVIPLYLPPLRDRPDDVEALAWHFLQQHEDTRAVRRISDGALDRLQDYDWPGNVRELQNVIEYATVMGEGPVLVETDLPAEVRGEDPARAAGVPTATGTTADDDLPTEARRLVNALERASGHMGRAAASLGISRTTLWRRLKRYGIDRDALEPAPEG